MKTFREFVDICESIAGVVAANRATIPTLKIKGPVFDNMGSVPRRPVNPKPQKPNLIGQLGRAVNTPVGGFVVNQVLRRIPHVKAASVINAGSVADGTLDAARKRGDLK